MMPFAQRPKHYLPAQDFADADAMIVTLHRLMDVPVERGDMVRTPEEQMAYAGELLEEIRSFRPQGAAQLDAALPELIEHAAATRHIGMLLCMKDCTTNAEMQQHIADAIGDVLAHLPKAEYRIFPEDVAFIRSKLEQEPLQAVNEADETAMQLGSASAALRLHAVQENDYLYSGRLGMRAHRLHRLMGIHKNTAPEQPDASLVANLQQYGDQAAEALYILGWNLTKPGEKNALYGSTKSLEEKDTQELRDTYKAQALEAELNNIPKLYGEQPRDQKNANRDHMKYQRPKAYNRLEHMGLKTVLSQLERLADKKQLGLLDQIRVGELLFALQEMHEDEGQRMLVRNFQRLENLATMQRNSMFLYALGQATTEPGQLLSTHMALQTVMGDEAERQGVEFLHGQWEPSAMLTESNQRLSDFAGHVEDWQAALIGMHLAQHELLMQQNAWQEPEYSYEELMVKAEEEQTIPMMMAMGYAQTAPGQMLINWKEIEATEREQDAFVRGQHPSLGDQVQSMLPSEPDELKRWTQRYRDAIQKNERGNSDSFLLN